VGVAKLPAWQPCFIRQRRLLWSDSPGVQSMSTASTQRPEAPVLERRATVRFAPGDATNCLLMLNGLESRWVLVRDLSRGGVGLTMSSELPAGTVVEVRLKCPRSGADIDLVAVVMCAQPCGDGTWHIGCAFRHLLTEETLQSLLS